MYAIPEKKPVSNDQIEIYSTYEKNKTKPTKNKRIHVTIQLHVHYVYTYDFRRSVVNDN